MYSLQQALLDHHLIVLRILGEWYDLDLIGQDKEACAEALSAAVHATDLQEEIVYLQLEELAALQALVAAEGRLPVATFGRKFGEVRPMGTGKLEREEPWLTPDSPAESLWYRGLLFRGFDESETGLIEYYFIPADLLPRIAAALPADTKPLPSTPAVVEISSTSKDEQGLADALADVERFIQKVKVKQGQGAMGKQAAENVPSLQPATVKPSPSIIAEDRPPAYQPRTVDTVKPSPSIVVEDRPPAYQPRTVDKVVVPIPPEKAAPTKKKVQPDSTKVVVTPSAFQPATTLAVDDLTTILAMAQRQPLQLPAYSVLQPFLRDSDPDRCTFLLQLALDAGLLRNNADVLRPTRVAVDWLQETREAQIGQLFTHWKTTGWDALHHIEQLICEGEWQHDPQIVRQVLLDKLPRTTDWVATAALIADIQQEQPDFQRPDGDYTSWYIRDRATDQFLTGFESWQAVEGRLLAYVLFRPMFWLGLIERSTDETIKAVRFHARALALLAKRPLRTKESATPITVQPNAVLQIPLASSRYQRFQATRIAELQPVVGQKPYQLRLTPASLKQAQELGITPPRVVQFLQKASGNRPIPASVKRAIERWAENGTEGRLEQLVVLRVADPAVLDTLRNNPKTRDLLGEVLGDMAIVVRAGQYHKLQQFTAQLGLLLEDQVIG